MSETTPQYIEPAGMLPEQFFADLPQAPYGDAERQLMLAILRDAVECHQKYARSRDFRTHQLFTEARTWIFSDDREWPFSYPNICDVLGLDPAYIRSGLTNSGPRGWEMNRRRPRIVTLGRERAASRSLDCEERMADCRKAS